ncbi:MAG: hypothetical protein AB8B91_23780 [Rubripirellula sp.]
MSSSGDQTFPMREQPVLTYVSDSGSVRAEVSCPSLAAIETNRKKIAMGLLNN